MTLSAPIRKLLALGILAALLWAGHVFVVTPLLERWTVTQSAMARQAELERRYLALGASREQLEGQLERIGERLSPVGLHFEESSDALVGAELQNQVKLVVEEAGGILNSTQVLPASDADPFRKVGVRVQMTGEVAAVQYALYQLETAKPYLLVDNLDVRRRVSRSRAGRTRSAESESRLTVRFDLYGFTRAESDDG